MSDDLIDRLRTLPPPLPGVPDRLELVRRRMVRRRRRLVAAGSAFALGVASVGTAVALTAGGLHTFSPQPAGSARSCPKSLDRGTTPVPRAAGVDATSRLVPAEPSPT